MVAYCMRTHPPPLVNMEPATHAYVDHRALIARCDPPNPRGGCITSYWQMPDAENSTYYCPLANGEEEGNFWLGLLCDHAFYFRQWWPMDCHSIVTGEKVETSSLLPRQ